MRGGGGRGRFLRRLSSRCQGGQLLCRLLRCAWGDGNFELRGLDIVLPNKI